MKLISLTQPWAALVAEGHKCFETRGWGTEYRGPLAIHATKGPADPAAMHRLPRLYPEVFAGLQTLGEHGKIIAVCTLAGCDRMEHRLDLVPGSRIDADTLREPQAGVTPQEVDFGDWRVWRYALALQQVRRTVPYAVYRGSQGRPIPLDPLVEAALVYL